MNTYVDKLVNQPADRDRATEAKRRAIISGACGLTSVATGLGVCTVAANAWRPAGGETKRKLRDCEPVARHSFRRCKDKEHCKAQQRKRLPRRPSSVGLTVAGATLF